MERWYQFRGVVAFSFADLLIIPIRLIYRKYYGRAGAVRLVAVFYVASVVAGYVGEALFGAVGLIPGGDRHAERGPDCDHLKLHQRPQPGLRWGWPNSWSPASPHGWTRDAFENGWRF